MSVRHKDFPSLADVPHEETTERYTIADKRPPIGWHCASIRVDQTSTWEDVARDAAEAMQAFGALSAKRPTVIVVRADSRPEELEQTIWRALLEQHDGNMSALARATGRDRQGLRRKLGLLGISMRGRGHARGTRAEVQL